MRTGQRMLSSVASLFARHLVLFTGESDNDWHGDDECVRCAGSGWYVEPSVFVLFRFDLVGRSYCWHVPADSVSFSYSTTGEASTWRPETEEKPVNLSPSRSARAKTLIWWVQKMVAF